MQGALRGACCALLMMAWLGLGSASAADISHYATGMENGPTGIVTRDQCDDAVESTDAPRTGSKCLSTTYNSNSNRRWYLTPTFAVPKNSYLHIIGYTKLLSTDVTEASSNTQAYAEPYGTGSSNPGDAVNLTKSWQRITASSKAGSDKSGVVARFYRKHASKKEVLFDDVVAYVSTNSEVDLEKPTSATAASATDTELTWTCGTDANTGIQATLIWKRTNGTAEDLTLNDQGIYALAATEGPSTDQSGNWTLVSASVAGDATSYSGALSTHEVYAIVHRDLAYNYSAPTYVTVPDLTPKTLYLKPGTNWLKKGGEVSPRFAVYAYIDGEHYRWCDMEAVDAGCEGGTVYKAVVPAMYPNCIFCRMDGATTENAWGGNVWNQTGDLTMPTAAAGVYEVPNSAWDYSNNDNWRTTPLNICISGTWLCFAGEQLTLTATSTGATHYQWYKGGVAIPGATSATYINYNFAYEDAGNYYCKSRIGESGTEIQSNTLTVKTLRMFFDNGRGGAAYGHVDLKNTDPDNHKATGMIFLGQTWTYAFCVADGVGHYYGCNNPESSKMHSGNCTNWEMNADGTQCLIWAENGATYTFTVDYSNFTVPVVSAVYPPDNQEAGRMIYFDNSTLNWSEPLYYRIGRGGRAGDDHTQVAEFTKVTGTANLYQYTTPAYTDMDAWHIADKQGHVGLGNGYSIYLTDTDDEYQITKSMSYEGGATTQDITVEPTGSHQLGKDSEYPNPDNDDCDFYAWKMLQGMKTQNVEIIAPEGGTITVSYTDVNGDPQSFTSGNRDLAHTCILTISASPDPCGYQLTSLTVNGVDFTSGETHVLDARTIIEATFGPATYGVTLHPEGGLILAGDVTSYTFGVGATLPTHMSKIGKDFLGWYDNSGLTGSPVTTITTADCGNKEYWAKWENERTKVTYIIGSCYLKNEVWTQGGDGPCSAWLFRGGDTPSENNVIPTTDIKLPSLNPANQWFLSKDVTLMPSNSMWGTSSNTNRAIRAFKVGSGSSAEFDLKELRASSIMFYVFPSSNEAYSVEMTVNGVTETVAIPAGEQYQIHRYDYFEGNYTGKFKIKSVGKESRVVIVVEAPMVTITFDKNDGSGTTTTQKLPKGAEGELDENPFTWADHKFIGWTEDPAGTGEIIYDKDVYSSETDVTLYAKWEEIIKTTITLDATGAYNGYTGSVVATYGEPMPEIAALPERVGYVFEGYYDQPNGAGTQYYTGLGTGVRNWDKTTAAETLYAMWLTPCDLVPTLSTPAPITTIWDQKKVDLGVVRLTCDFDTTGVEYVLQSVSPTDPINGCHFEYFDEQVHLMGIPNVGNTTTQEVTVTFTLANNCSPASTYTITQTIRIYPASQKPKIAFILTGTKDGKFDKYSTTDSTACSSLIDYLDDFYDVTCVNGYSTKNTTAIENYYKDYDLLIVTDFLNTKEGYTNAIGSLIDKKPILSFEAYVANLSNWHIGSNPKDPNPPVGTMKVLCAGHAIFGDAEGVTVFNKPGGKSDTTITVLSSLSEKGLQGFVINEAPDFIFLATVRDTANNRDLVVCCERQIVFPARLLIYGINHNEMGNLSPAGRVVMHQMIDYLLMTDETSIADCSLVFDNAAGDHKWSNPANWSPGRNIIPTPYHPTRIIAECWVDTDDAHAGSVKVNTNRAGQPVIHGKLIVKPYGGLTVAGMVQKVHDTRYATPIVIKAEDLLIEADATKNGAFVYGNKESDVRATVEYYSRAEGANTGSPVWQYVGIPFQAGHTAINMYYAAWMCRWTTAADGSLGGQWQWVENDDVMFPFEGYCITQAAPKTYTFAGKLNAPTTKTLLLNHRDADGYAFAANSWTAPIKIQEMQDADFTNVEKAIYIYHSGSYANWGTNGSPVNAASGSAATLPGQYAVIPIHSSPYLAGADSVIPAMQGFFVKATGANPMLKLVYNRVVYDAKYFKTSTQPMRAPSRSGAPEVMQLIVSGEGSGADRVHILSRGDFTDEYMDGWDGRKLDGDAAAPKLAVVKEAGEMSVAALPTADERYLSFRAGNDSLYTFSFDYDGETIYLYDRVTEEATEIRTGNTYTFWATNHTASNRFLITTTPPLKTPTSIAVVETGDGLHVENYGGETVEVRIVDMQGRVLYRLESSESILDIAPSLPAGVYLAHIVAGEHKAVVKLIGGQAQ